ncbi:hypothetical protein H6B15_14770 [Gemmiger formicilis]|uniref:S24 family peptidase n=1 Tax=Gemmiger formicilis TaxID=745368 RepID=UPI00195B693F|nr:S24 family peptidase [Gemmiger formicilis]MBM6717919.1 hypothetical protein [Gemmiger formicilis]
MTYGTKEMELPHFLGADFAMTYTGRTLPSLGLMFGDVVCIQATSDVTYKSLVVIREQEENLLCKLFDVEGGISLVPADPYCPPRFYLGEKRPVIIGQVTGWIHREPTALKGGSNETE